MECMTTVLVAGVVCLFTYWIWKRQEKLKTFVRMQLPGPTPSFFIGNVTQMRKLGLLETFVEWGKEYGKCYGAFTPFPTMVVSDPEILRDLMVKKFASFPNRYPNNFMNYKPWSDSILQLRNDHWRHVRSQLSPTFSSGMLKKMMPTIQSMLQNLDRYVRQNAGTGQEVELKHMAGCFTMDCIAGAAFGMQVDSLANPQEPFSVNGLAIMKQRLWLIPLLALLPKLSNVLGYFGLTFIPWRPTKFFLDIMDAALQDRRKDATSHRDFLQLLVDAEKEGCASGPVDAEIDHSAHLTTSGHWTAKGLTDDEMKANAFLFFLAGYDTTAVVMSFTLFHLAANPDALKKAQEEVDKKLGKNPVCYDTASDLTYLDMCINEAMRLNPAGFLLDREALEDTELGGYPVKKGMRVIIPAYFIHRDPDYWPDPMKYLPERHSPEAKANRHPFIFLPFGHGPRNCIGLRLAQLEIRMALATILQHHTPLLCDKSVYPPRLGGTKIQMAAIDGLWVKFEPRY